MENHHADSEDQISVEPTGRNQGKLKVRSHIYASSTFCSDYFRSEFISWITVGWFRPYHWDDYFINNGVKPSHCFGILNI